MEPETDGYDFCYTYGLDVSVKITSEGTNWWGQNVKEDILKDYLHQDRLGSTTNLTDQFGRVVGRADYNEWGEITYREALDITSSYRRIWPQSSYTDHDWDDVLGMYYAKARFYSAEDKRFVAVDPVKGQIIEPLSLVPYVYCVDNPLRWVDPMGLRQVPNDLGHGGGSKPSKPQNSSELNQVPDSDPEPGPSKDIVSPYRGTSENEKCPSPSSFPPSPNPDLHLTPDANFNPDPQSGPPKDIVDEEKSLITPEKPAVTEKEYGTVMGVIKLRFIMVPLSRPLPEKNA